MAGKKKSNGVLDVVRDSIFNRLHAFNRVFKSELEEEPNSSAKEKTVKKAPENNVSSGNEVTSSPSLKGIKLAPKETAAMRKPATNVHQPKSDVPQSSSAETIRLKKTKSETNSLMKKPSSAPSKSPDNNRMKIKQKRSTSPKALPNAMKKDKDYEKRELLARLTNELVRLQSCDDGDEAQALCNDAVSESKQFEKAYKDAKYLIRTRFRELAVECQLQKEHILQELNGLAAAIEKEMSTQLQQERELNELLKEISSIDHEKGRGSKRHGREMRRSSTMSSMLLVFLVIVIAIAVMIYRRRQ